MVGIQPPNTRDPIPGFPILWRNDTQKHPIKDARYSGGIYRLNTVFIIVKKNRSINRIPGIPRPMAALNREL